MEDMENDSDWDTEEFQAALKTVLKYEIQSLLERLSQTGEETVLLAVNTVDMCVSHLASANAQKFVNTVDVGQIKTKFLHFVSGQPMGRMDLGKSDVDCGTFSDSEINSQGKWGGSSSSLKFGTKRGHDLDLQAHENQNMSLKRQKLDDSAILNNSQLKKNVNVPSTSSGSISNKTLGEVGKLPPHAYHSNEDSMPDKQHDLAAIKGKKDIKLTTTKIVSKSGGFTEERLSDTEFKNLLKLCNSDVEKEVGDQLPKKVLGPAAARSQQQLQQAAFGRGINPKMTSTPNVHMLGTARTIPDAKTPQSDLKNKVDVRTESEKNTNLYKTANVGNKPKAITSAIPDFSKENDSSKIKIQPLLNMPEIKEEVDPNDTEYKQSEQNKSTTPIASQEQLFAGKQPEKQCVQGKENRAEGPVLPNIKGSKPITQATSLQKPQRSVNEDDLDTETLIRMAKEKHKETQSDADKAIQAKLGQLSSKLSWVVEYPKEKQQDSLRKSYPGENTLVKPYFGENATAKSYSGENTLGKPYPGEKTPPKQVFGNLYGANPMLDDDEEEDDEDYDGEDFDDELDEEEIAALKALHANKLLRLRDQAMHGFHHTAGGNMPGEYGAMGYHGEYGEEDEDYEDYGEYDNMGEEGDEMEEDRRFMGPIGRNYEQYMQHGGNMGAFSEGAMGSFGEGGSQGLSQNQQYPDEPAFSNFLLMGIMAKCLICNKIIRKTEMDQHNQIHFDEEEEGEDENYGEENEEHWGDEEGGGEEDLNTGEEDYNAGEEEYNEGEDMIPQGDGDIDPQGGRDYQGGVQEAEQGEEYEENAAPEFVAEKFVAEKVVENEEHDIPVSVACESPKKSTVCDICNKQFKSVGNMQRHRKTHTDTTKHPCQFCDKTFRSTGTLLAHVKKKHPEHDLKTSENPENVLQCGVCAEKFTEACDLQEHEKSHGDAEW